MLDGYSPVFQLALGIRHREVLPSHPYHFDLRSVVLQYLDPDWRLEQHTKLHEELNGGFHGHVVVG